MILFRYKKEEGESGSVVKRPVADVFLKSIDGPWIEFHPYIDSGADLTMIPLSLGKLLGFKKRDGKIKRIGGISGSAPVIFVRGQIKIGDYQFSIRLAWCQTENVPPLLGRADIFDQFDIIFKQTEELILFEKRKLKQA